MYEAQYYREKATHARRLAGTVTDDDAIETLLGFAQEFDDIAEDLERGAIHIRHEHLMPQRQRGGEGVA